MPNYGLETSGFHLAFSWEGKGHSIELIACAQIEGTWNLNDDLNNVMVGQRHTGFR